MSDFDNGYQAALRDAVDEVRRIGDDDENCLVLQSDVLAAIDALKEKP